MSKPLPQLPPEALEAVPPQIFEALQHARSPVFTARYAADQTQFGCTMASKEVAQ
jgi:hypothetical protein